MTFWTALRRTYADSWRFVVALPFLAAAIVGFEALQHVVEWRAGMYTSIDAARRVANDPGRMTSGLMKVGWLLILQFWVTRFIVTKSARDTFKAEPVATRKFAWVFALSFGLAVVTLLLPSLFPAGSARKTAAISVAIFQLVTLPLAIALAPWGVGAAIGDGRASPLFALRRCRGSILWGLALKVAAILPVMAVHYGLGLGAIGKAPRQAVAMLAVDALFVGYLGIVISASEVMVAERMALRAGEVLALHRGLRTTV